jgi:hypothetical protein
MGRLFKVPAFFVWFVGGLWSFVICINMVPVVSTFTWSIPNPAREPGSRMPLATAARTRARISRGSPVESIVLTIFSTGGLFVGCNADV